MNKWRLVIIVEDHGHTDKRWAGGAADVQEDVERYYTEAELAENLEMGWAKGLDIKVESIEPLGPST